MKTTGGRVHHYRRPLFQIRRHLCYLHKEAPTRLLAGEVTLGVMNRRGGAVFNHSKHYAHVSDPVGTLLPIQLRRSSR
jgi:hypothetical protein